jgi:SET domain
MTVDDTSLNMTTIHHEDPEPSVLSIDKRDTRPRHSPLSAPHSSVFRVALSILWCAPPLIFFSLLLAQNSHNNMYATTQRMSSRRSFTLILILLVSSSGCMNNAVVEAALVLAAAASRRPLTGAGSGFGGGGGTNANKSKKPITRRKQQQQQQQQQLQQQVQVQQPLYIPDTSSATQDLVSFCNNVLEYEGMDDDGGGTEIGICTKTKMRGLYATDSFSAGEFILGIPFVSCVTLARDDLTTKDDPNEAELGCRLLQRINNDKDTAQQQAQSWNPYFQSLPSMKEKGQTTHFDTTPDFFTRDEIQALECPILIQKAMDRKQQVQQRSARILLEEAEQNDGTDDDDDHNRLVVELDVRQLQFATWLVKSRGFTLLKPVRRRRSSMSSTVETDDDVDSSLSDAFMTNAEDEEGATSAILLSKTVLMPYMDMINHSHNANCQLVVVETKAEEESFYALQALRPISKGQEITITYGVGGQQQQQQGRGYYSAMIDLFANYGFLSPPPPPPLPSLPQHRDLNNNDDGLFTWTTTLKADEQLLKELETTAVEEALQSNMRRVLEFRIHMKRAQQQQQHNNK